MNNLFKSSIFNKGLRLMFSLLIAYFLYQTTFNVYDPNFLPSYRTEGVYPFYSGNIDGAYYSIGHALENNYIDKYKNFSTNGSVENNIKLAQETHAFGMIGENLYNQIGNQNDIIGDIYEEKLHVIFRRNSNSYKYQNVLVLKKDNHDENIFKLFKESIINKGQPNSQVADIADHILENILPKYNNIKDDTAKFYNLPLDQSIKNLKNGKIQVLFFMSGYTEEFKNLLKDTSTYGLISLDISLFDELKSKYATSFRYSDFADNQCPYGETYKKTMTISLKAFLVASKNTPFLDKLQLIENLDKIKNTIPALKDKDFLQQFKEKNKKYESWLYIAIILISLYAFIAFHFILWIFSEIQRTIYFNKINNNAIHRIPKNDDIEDKNEKHDIEKYLDKTYVFPVIIENQIAIVNRAIRALAFISKARTEISNLFDRGWLKSSHYRFLMEKSDDIAGKLRKTLAVRLNGIIERDETPLQTPLIGREYLRKYLTADYLNQKDYEWLIAKVDKKEVSSITKKLLIDMLSKASYRETIDLLIKFFNTKDEKFITENDKQLYNEIILISAEFYQGRKEKDEFPENYKRHLKAIHSKLVEYIEKLEKEKLLD